tara:strand:- start:71 stop:412 length:342 start_codon:yes stop_codon:yes gene_type:complete
MISKRMLRRALGFSVLHFFLVMISLFGALHGFSALDEVDYHPPWFEVVGGTLFPILGFPVVALWALVHKTGHHLSDFFEWTFTLLNSLLWGFGLALLMEKFGTQSNDSSSVEL